MSFANIPAELKAIPQWIVWKLVEREGLKPTKVPINPKTGFPASVTDPSDWSDFATACANAHKVNGIGFVFTENDPYFGLDLDDVHGDTEAFARQQKIHASFDSYSEFSPSGLGLHIIGIGNFDGPGRRRAGIELYCKERFFTMTGNVYNDKPIGNCQNLVDILYEEMGGAPVEFTVTDQPETLTDDEVIERAATASNGDLFSALHAGDWEGRYKSQSEADIAYVNIIAFYSRNADQIRRLFRASALGQTPKDNYEHRGDRVKYVDYMIRKSYDNQLPPLDIEGLAIKAVEEFRARISTQNDTRALGQPTLALPDNRAEATLYSDAQGLASGSETSNPFPPGLLGEIAQFFYDQSPRPVVEASLAGAIGFLSGITGRAFNTYTGAGLNQYILLLAPTGTGKDAISMGMSKLLNACSHIKEAKDFMGPGELVSSAGLIKWMARKPCVVSILGEVGLMMQQMASPHANAHLKGLQRVMTQMYSKSGAGNTFDPSAYSDKEKTVDSIFSPSLTILGESVPGEFYDYIDEKMIASGLLPRFTTFEYLGTRPYYREGAASVMPSQYLVGKVSDLIAQSLQIQHTGNTHFVNVTPDAHNLFTEYDKWTTDEINKSSSEVVKHLWNRAHLKALKLASVWAIGVNYLNPVVDMISAVWATDLVAEQTRKLIAKFEKGNIGASVVNNFESQQLHDMAKTIGKYCYMPLEASTRATSDMHRDKVFPLVHIQHRLYNKPTYKNDRLGPNNAIKRALSVLLENDEIREVPKIQMQAKYGTGAKGYVIARSDRFIHALEDKS